MAISQPIATDNLDSPDHSKLHRIIAADLSASDEAFVVNADDNLKSNSLGLYLPTTERLPYPTETVLDNLQSGHGWVTKRFKCNSFC